jgi:cyclopropane fatty-acyl-phospholipid synthase-like methyltransferase
MSKVKSPITGGNASNYCRKGNIFYYKCEDTGTIFTAKELTNSDMVGGTGEESRNYSEHNATRLQRIKSLNSNPFVLDFGCGLGTFVDYLKANGVRAVGYDKFSEDFAQPPIKNSYDVITCIEVIEHLYKPYNEFKEMYDALNKGGYLYIESSFSDWVDMDHPYLNPAIGHQTIFSHKGLNIVLTNIGFEELTAINPNVRIFRKL